MKGFKFLFLAVIALVASSAFGQAWTSAYEAGLKAAKGGQWSEARTDFLKAAAYRPEDVSGPTLLPGPVTERRTWRGGAPYSPNFLAAYAGFKAASAMAPGEDQNAQLKTAAGELEERIAKGQQSRAAYYFLTAIYSKLGDVAKRDEAVKNYQAAGDKANWKVDNDGISPEDLGQINSGSATPSAGGSTGGGNIAGTVKPDANGTVPLTLNNLASVVTSVPTKFALIIGNSESKMPGQGVSFASDDAQSLRQALVTNGGYLDGNVDVVVNATAAQIMTSANALASRMPNGGTLLLFFAGRGVNVNGKDYLAAVDTGAASDITSMVAKSDLLDPFTKKSSRVFCFFEVGRQVQDGRFFGMELPMSGEISQMFATAQGSDLTSIYRENRPTGIFVDAFINVLEDLKSNGIPILEFGWQVFNKMRHGNTGQNGGGSTQTPTLPILSHMAADAKF